MGNNRGILFRCLNEPNMSPVMLGIGIKQFLYHFLILRMMFFRFTFEKIKAFSAESERYFNVFLFKKELFRWWQKIFNYANIA